MTFRSLDKREDGLIRPFRNVNSQEIGTEVLMVLVRYELKRIIDSNPSAVVDQSQRNFFKLYTLRTKAGRIFSVAGPFLGSPQAAMGLEVLIANGIRKVWVYGWCGSVSPQLRVGDLFIPAAGLIDEGTSAHYPLDEPSPRSDEVSNHQLKTFLRGKGYSFQHGPIWTTDAPFRETPARVIEFAQKGALAVDMEMSALMTVALFYQIQLAGLLVVSDELFELTWRPGFSDPAFKTGSREAGGLMMDFLSGSPIMAPPEERNFYVSKDAPSK